MDTSHTQDNDSTDTKDSQLEMLSEAQVILRTLLKLHAEDGEQAKIERNRTNLYKTLGVKPDTTSAQSSAKDAPLYIPSGAVDYLAQIEKAKSTKTVGTSLTDLDQVLGGGLEPKRLMVLLGAPGGGKTTLANQIAWSASMAGRPVLFVSSEEQPFSLLSKTLARIGKIPYTAVLKGHEEWMPKIKETLLDYQQTLAATRLAYMDITMGGSLETIESGAEKLFEQFKSNGNGILVIDYLQNVARQLINSRRSATQDVRLAVTEPSQKAPFFRYGDEWLFLMERGTGPRRRAM
jgi:predicted ATP-dependent serine protease